MSKTAKLALAAAIPVLLLAGCSDFLKGPGLSNNPNKPTTATANQLWVGVEVAVMAQWENYPMMLFQTWTQQIAGVNRQWQTYAVYNVSGTTASTINALWDQTYGPGGLIDIKSVEASNTADGALQWRGQTRVLEALYMGTAADIFGSVPYTNALSAAPTFDSQSAVYAHVQALLDSAITDLASTDGKVPTVDFFYGSDPVKWTALAHTLKARFYMHTAPTSATTYDATILGKVITETGLGISSAAGDMLPSHTSTPGEQNLFFSFQVSRAGDVSPAATHIKLIKTQAADAFLLPKFYIPNVNGNYYGSTAGLPGDAPDGVPAESVAVFSVSVDPTQAWGIVTYTENQMLLAEAQVLTGSFATGLATLNSYRSANGSANITPAPGTAAAVEQVILREKFIRNFFSMETWNDYNRTCYPNAPAPVGSNALTQYVPARFPVGQIEQNTNPNVPAQPAGNPPNANNFKHLLALDGTSCVGQVNLP